MDKDKIRATLESAVNTTHEKYEFFQGILIYGSFVTDKEDPGDVDIIPVLTTYDDNWDFSSWAEDIEWHGDDYYRYREMEEYFVSQLLPLPDGFEAPLKERYGQKALVHISSQPGLIALDDLKFIKERLTGWKVNYINFIGIDEAHKVLLSLDYNQ